MSEEYVAPLYYHVRYTSAIVTGSDFFEGCDPTAPLNLNASLPDYETIYGAVEIKLESFATLIEAMRRAADIIEELETPHHGWIEIMIYYFDTEDESSDHESYYCFFSYNPEIGITQ